MSRVDSPAEYGASSMQDPRAPIPDLADPLEEGIPLSQTRLVWRSLRRDRTAMLGAIILFLVLLATLFAPVLSPQDPLEQSGDPADYLSPPSLAHPMGTDELRRDILSRMLHGSRNTIKAGVIPVFGAAISGLILGMAAAFFGGRIDEVIGRVNDVVLTLPGILLAIVIVAILGPSLQNAMLAVGISSVPSFTRLVRGAALIEKNKEYIEAAYAIGSRPWTIIWRHLLRNVLAPVIVFGTLSVANAIQITAGLSFLGLGAQPPQPEWGSMLSNGRNFIRTGDWWMTVFPGLAILIVVLSINLLGDGLRDAIDPRLRGASG